MPQIHLDHVLERLLRACKIFFVFQQRLGRVKLLLLILALLLNLTDLPLSFLLQRTLGAGQALPNLLGLIELAVLPKLLGLLLHLQVFRRRRSAF